MGFVFYEKSPRNLNLNDVHELKKYDKQKSSFTAVTVNPSNEFIQKMILGNFDYIPSWIRNKWEAGEIKSMGLKIIKAIKIKDETDIKNYKKYNNADIILFDTPGMEKSIEFPKKFNI